MNEKDKKRISKFLSLLLRHRPEKIGLKLDENGWADIEELRMKSAKHKVKFTFEELEEVVNTNNKMRFIISDDQTKVRANQGHSLKDIDLEFENVEPPEFLYHGTVSKFMSNIKQQGLKKMNRQHVHLSKDRETAINVGSRRGNALILSIRSGEMYREGLEFYCSENGVWLANEVPTKYIDFKD